MADTEPTLALLTVLLTALIFKAKYEKYEKETLGDRGRRISTRPAPATW